MRGADEAALYDTYAKRIAQSGRNIGLDGLHLTEIKEQSGANEKALCSSRRTSQCIGYRT